MQIAEEKAKITQEISNLQTQLIQVDQVRTALQTEIIKRQGMLELLQRMNGTNTEGVINQT